MIHNSKKSFTLIELLVVIAIIGLLTGIIIIGLKDAMARGRDARRIAEVNQISKALELYRADHDKYPIQEGDFVCIEEYPDFASEMKPYLPNIPQDPLYPQLDSYEQISKFQCPLRKYCYSYESFDNGQKYAIRAKLEKGDYFSIHSSGVGEINDAEEAKQFGFSYVYSQSQLPEYIVGQMCVKCQSGGFLVCPWAYQTISCREIRAGFSCGRCGLSGPVSIVKCRLR